MPFALHVALCIYFDTLLITFFFQYVFFNSFFYIQLSTQPSVLVLKGRYFTNAIRPVNTQNERKIEDLGNIPKI